MPSSDCKKNKRLVKVIIKQDFCNIFYEYGDIHADISGDLEVKVNEVKEFVKEVLNPELNLKQKYNLLHEFTRTFDKKSNNT